MCTKDYEKVLRTREMLVFIYIVYQICAQIVWMGPLRSRDRVISSFFPIQLI